ncbi:MAG TPA: TRAP transporter small permease [Rhodocyclaceae bacterium]|nr:TRAP transporter small permease [Rhodocyclaceae bacterium]
MGVIRKFLDLCIEAFACLAFAAMIFVSTWQIISRYVFHDPIIFSEEFLRYGLIWMSMVGLAYANGKSAHITLDLFKDMPPDTKRRLTSFSQIMLMLFALAVMIGGGIRATHLAANQLSPVLGISMGWIYVALPVSGVLTVIYGVLNLVAPVAPNGLSDIDVVREEHQGEHHAV